MSIYVEGSSPFDPNTLFDNLCWYLEDYFSAISKLGISGEYEVTYIEAEGKYTSTTPAQASLSVSFVYSEDVPIEVRWYVDDKPLQTVDPETFEWIDRVDTAINNYNFSDHIDFESGIGSHYVHCVVTVFGSNYTSPKLEIKVVEDIPHETPTISTTGADAVYRLDAENVTELKASALVTDEGILHGAWWKKSDKAEYGDIRVSEDCLGSGAVSASFTPPIDEPGTYEYYFRTTNHSPIDDLDSYAEAKSETIKITVLPPFDLKSFQLGIAAGLGLTGWGYVHEGKLAPTAYLYNGVQLPALPEWDMETYPYAVIAKNDYTAYLYLSTCPMKYHYYTNYIAHLVSTDDGYAMLYKGMEDGEVFDSWNRAEIVESGSAFTSPFTAGYHAMQLNGPSYECLWANYDVIDNEDGTLRVAASEPVPVYE